MPGETSVLAPESLVDGLTELLRDDIVRGSIRPGEQITEGTLARKLGISRNPTREAVCGLEGSGLPINHPRRGRFARQTSRDEADGCFCFRSSIECSSFAPAARVRTGPEVAALPAVLDTMHAAAARGDAAGAIAQDARFHRFICESAGSRRALRLFDEIPLEMQNVLRVVGISFTTMEQTASAHDLLPDVFVAGDAAVTERVTQKHIDDAHREVGAKPDNPKH